MANTEQVVILAGGKGTRLHELTHDTPKALAPINGRPIVWHIMRHYADHGLKRFIVCAGANAHLVKAYFSDRQEWEVEVSDIGPEATKSQRIAAVLPRITGDRFMLAYGDDLCDVDVREVERDAVDHDSTVTLTAVRPRSPFGVLEVASEGAVMRFVEKQRMPDWINGGYMTVHRRVSDLLPLGEFEQAVFGALIAKNELRAFRHAGYWQAMNTYKDYLELNELAERGLCPVIRTQAGMQRELRA